MIRSLLDNEKSAMKYFVACLGTETNSFSPLPTNYQNYAESVLYHGDATQHSNHLFIVPLKTWRQMAEKSGSKVVESLSAFSQPAGITLRTVYEDFREEILKDLKQALPIDVVLLSMHGAMIADGYPDCEGDLLKWIRKIVGPQVPVGAELDLHCHITNTMVENATAIIIFKEYPHIDLKERAEELFTLCTYAAQGKIEPLISIYDCRMIGTWPTEPQPMRGFVDRMRSLEGKHNVLSVSLAHGFPWGDVPDVGAKVLVITNSDPEKGNITAQDLGREFWAIRNDIGTEYLKIDEALDRAMESEGGPIVIADAPDNPGGGAPGDSTFILKRVIDRDIKNIALIGFWDPLAVRFCFQAGEGTSFDLRVGGKCGQASGDPVDLHVTVKRLIKDAKQTFLRTERPVGDAAWVSADDVDLVLISQRSQTGHPDLMTQFGLDPLSRKIIVVKSSQHFRAGFVPIARDIFYVRAPGAVTRDFAKIPYKNKKGPYWPRVTNPFSS